MLKTAEKSLATAAILFIFLFLAFGAIAGLVPNPWFTRMVEENILDYLFLSASSLLMSIYITIHLRKRSGSKKCNIAASSGGVGSVLAFSCPICNKLLVLVLGTTFLLVYFEPYRQLLGFMSIILLAAALYFKLRPSGNRPAQDS